MSETIAIIATCDTKGEEALYLKHRIESCKVSGLVVDSGILGEPVFLVPDVTRDQVAEYSGATIKELVNAGSRGAAVEKMRDCIHAYVNKLYKEGKIQGLIAIGGAEGSVIARAAMDALPLGVPKIAVSTIASGKHLFSDLIGYNDATVMHSVIDILGINSISRKVFNNAVGAIVGMVKVKPEASEKKIRSIAISMLGTTTKPIMSVIKPGLEKRGFEVLTFHANGTGGDCMDTLVSEGYFAGVLDFSTNELVANNFGGLHVAKSKRMEAALEKGVPTVVAPGAANIIVLSREEALQSKYDDRQKYYHNPNITLINTTVEELEIIATTFAEKLNKAEGKIRFIYPTQGFCSQDKEGLALWNPEGNPIFLKELKKSLRPDIPIIEVDAHINDDKFANVAFEQLLAAMGEKK
ncbi:MAG: Tm-1-like ATP-binding domain-containing protein [Deltaproteobacteria bacterium]|nr:Tm-1-like ATP-binding domain-containing protein [Deltaproteobacteria bacterium]